MNLTLPALVILVGPSGAGKSTWAAEAFRPNEVVSSDALRSQAGINEDDQAASTDAFFLLREIAERRLARRLTTVIDTTGLTSDERRRLIGRARDHKMSAHAVVFDTDAEVCRERNAARGKPIPKATHNKQFTAYKRNRAEVFEEGFDSVLEVSDSGTMPTLQSETTATAVAAGHRQAGDPTQHRFGLLIGRFDFDTDLGPGLADVARVAEEAGFDSIWVMDHLRQIPQVGRAWDDLPECYTTLAFLAGVTERVRLGALVSPILFRNPALLGKMIGTLDVVSGGRAICGLGIGWFEAEAAAYGFEFPPTAVRYEQLQEALEILRLIWGPGSPEFEGRHFRVPEALAYPRPAQERIPILVGGSGEKKTLRVVAEKADMCNLFGDPETIAHKVGVLRRHCEELGRDPDEITVTHLASTLTAPDQSALRQLIDDRLPPNTGPDDYAAQIGAGTVDQQIGRFRAYAEAGADYSIVTMAGAPSSEVVAGFAPVIGAFT